MSGFLLIGKLSRKTKERLYPSFEPTTISNDTLNPERETNSSDKPIFKEKIVEKNKESRQEVMDNMFNGNNPLDNNNNDEEKEEEENG